MESSTCLEELVSSVEHCGAANTCDGTKLCRRLWPFVEETFQADGGEQQNVEEKKICKTQKKLV